MNELLHKYISSIKIEQFGKSQFPVLSVGDRWRGDVTEKFVLKPDFIAENQSYYLEVEFWHHRWSCSKNKEALEQINSSCLKITDIQQEKASDSISVMRVSTYNPMGSYPWEDQNTHITIYFYAKTDINIISERLSEQ